ncbi:MAG: hypothetical protein AAB327_08360, partial [Actinomycetota bacterium]
IRPLFWLSLAADHALWGLNPLGYHLTGILLHLLNTALLATLARTLARLSGHPSPRGVATAAALGDATLVVAL